MLHSIYFIEIFLKRFMVGKRVLFSSHLESSFFLLLTKVAANHLLKKLKILLNLSQISICTLIQNEFLALRSKKYRFSK